MRISPVLDSGESPPQVGVTQTEQINQGVVRYTPTEVFRDLGRRDYHGDNMSIAIIFYYWMGAKFLDDCQVPTDLYGVVVDSLTGHI